MRKKFKIQLEHKTFGFGFVQHRAQTDNGAALVMAFRGKKRMVLVNSDAWANPQDAIDAHQYARDPRRRRSKPKDSICFPRRGEMTQGLHVVPQTAELGHV